MNMYRFYTGHYVSYGYVDIMADSKAKAVSAFKRDYMHLLRDSGRLYTAPIKL